MAGESRVYGFLDKFFFGFHSLVILFSLLGWLWTKTRRLNLILLLLTGFSWGVLGIWYGFGYCPSTDWHWQVRMKLGRYDMPASYTKFLVDSITGLDVNARLVDALTLIFFLIALTVSMIVNIRDWRRRDGGLRGTGAGG